MKILFDNNGFARLVQKPQCASTVSKLERLVQRGTIEVIGCCTMLRELSGISQTMTNVYLDTLGKYEQLTQGKILEQSNKLVLREVKQQQPQYFPNSLLSIEATNTLFDNLKRPSIASEIFQETVVSKQGYATTMENARDNVLAEPQIAAESEKAIRKGYEEWHNQFEQNIQDCFVHLFDVKSNFSVKQLPHVSALLGYALTRIYERFTLNKKDNDNDLLDRTYFTDAAVVDILVTDDRPFTRTSLRVPNRTFEVINADEELQQLIDKSDAG
jgi:hypothetical protein